ncbi:MAG: hypothetical protein L3J97_03710, partial [Thermoplasmata archaeon]|nr:hypothetical protein [Thermoplasmata archaeon]
MAGIAPAGKTLGSAEASSQTPAPTETGWKAWMRRNRAQVTLVVLAVTIPELLTGSTPVTNLINPIAVAGLLGFYGAGVLLIREASVFYRKGWSMVLLLGLAYGIAEEGIATKTMVDPQSGAAGFLGMYGHAAGVNWVFAVVIALFHALYSIALPILIVELLYPGTKGQRFLTNRGAKWTFVILGLAVTWGYFGFDPHYFEGYAVFLFLFLIMVALVAAAFLVPARWLTPQHSFPSLTPGTFFWIGASFAAGWSLFYLFAPHVIAIPAIVILGELLSATGVLLV